MTGQLLCVIELTVGRKGGGRNQRRSLSIDRVQDCGGIFMLSYISHNMSPYPFLQQLNSRKPLPILATAEFSQALTHSCNS
eukprot:364266-Chlamydomonas_euryale.AAC.9